jgi:hypothetical protein
MNKKLFLGLACIITLTSAYALLISFGNDLFDFDQTVTPHQVMQPPARSATRVVGTYVPHLSPLERKIDTSLKGLQALEKDLHQVTDSPQAQETLNKKREDRDRTAKLALERQRQRTKSSGSSWGRSHGGSSGGSGYNPWGSGSGHSGRSGGYYGGNSNNYNWAGSGSGNSNNYRNAFNDHGFEHDDQDDSIKKSDSSIKPDSTPNGYPIQKSQADQEAERTYTRLENAYKDVEKQLADMIELRKTQPNQVERVQSLLADDSFTSIATLCAEAAAQRKSLNSDALEVLEKNASSRTQETKKSSAKIQLSPSATRINETITRHFQTLVDDIAMAATLSDYEGGSPNPSAKALLTKEIASRIGKKTVDDAFQKRADHVLKLWSSANPKLNSDIMQLTSAGTRTAPGGDDLDAARNAAKSNITAAKDKLAGLFKNFPRTTAGQISAEIKRLDTALANS